MKLTMPQIMALEHFTTGNIHPAWKATRQYPPNPHRRHQVTTDPRAIAEQIIRERATAHVDRDEIGDHVSDAHPYLPDTAYDTAVDHVRHLLETAVVTVTWPDDAGHPETWCEICGGANVAWCAPSPIWNAVMRDGDITRADEYGIVCPRCFAVRAEALGVAGLWRLDAEYVHVPLVTVTPSGRVWDSERWLWVEPVELSIQRDQATPETVPSATQSAEQATPAHPSEGETKSSR